MASEDTIQPKFYSVWPNTGKKFSQQLGEIRTDTSSLTPIARAVGFDAAGDWSDLDGIAANSVQAYEIGQDGFHNRYRTHYNKDDDLFEIASNHGTEDVPQWYTMWWVDNDGHVTQQNTPTTVSNIGSGEGWFKQKVGVDLEFKSITATSPITIVNDGNSIDIDGSDLISNYSSLGGDEDVITAKSGSILPFKGFSAGPNMVVRDQGTYLEFESTSQVVEFYGIIMSHSDGGTVYDSVHHLIVNREDFYLTQETTHPSDKTVILNNISDPFNSSDYVAVIGDDMIGQLAMHDGTAAEPAIGFTADTTMGLYRNAANDLGVAIGGAAHTRFLSDRLFLAQDLQVTAGGSAASPDIYFFPDSDTGVYQPELDSIGFTTGGTRAGYFTSNQDFYVTGRILVGNGSQANPSMVFGSDQELGLNRESAGILNINSTGAARLQVASDEIVPTVPVRPNFDGTSSSVAYGWDSDVGTGFFLSTSGGNSTLALAVDTSTVMEVGVNTGFFKTYLPFATVVAGTAAYPSYSWFDYRGTGLYNKAASELGFATGASGGSGSYAGHIDAAQKWWFANDIDVSSGDVTVQTEVYGAGWDGDLTVPTKDAVYDQIETIGGFYGVVFRESEAGGAVYQTDALTVDSGIFYLSTGGDGKPILGLIEGNVTGVASFITEDEGSDAYTYPVFVNEPTGVVSPKTNTGFRYNSAVNELVIGLSFIGSNYYLIGSSLLLNGGGGIVPGEISDISGAISFKNENLSTTGTLSSGALTCTTINTGTGARELDQDVTSGSTPTFTATNITGVPAESVLAGAFGSGAYAFDDLVSQKVEANNVTYGAGAGESIESGASHNTCIGFYTGTKIMRADDNTLIGYNAGATMTTGGFNNTFIGSQAGALQTSGDNQVAIGFEAGMANNTAGSAVAIGYQAGKNNIRNSNTFIGYRAGSAITTISSNTYIGYNTGYQQTTGAGTVCIGANAGAALTTAGDGNIIIGKDAGLALETGAGNTLMGNKAGEGLVDGANNTIVGQTAGTGGDFSNGTMFGSQAGRDNTGAGCTFIGTGAGRLNTGGNNTAVGALPFYDNEDGAANVAIGSDCLSNNVSGDHNVAIGYRALRLANGAGDYNTAIGGYSQGHGADERFRNITMGYYSGDKISTGDDNIFIGHQAGQAVTTSNSNTCIGTYAGLVLTGGSNVFLGNYAGRYQVAVSDKLIIDNRSQGSDAAELTDALIVGDFHATPSSQVLTFNADTTITYKLRSTAQAGGTTDGDIWNDSTQKALQTFVSGIEQTLSGCIFTQTADQTIANTTTETTMFGTGVGTLTLPANFWTVGKTIRVEIHGDFADTGNPTAEIQAYYGETSLIDSGAIALSGLGGTEEWECEVIITCRSVGGSGTLQTVIDWEYETTTGSSAIERLDVAGALQTVDTTASGALDVTFQWGTAAAANTIHSHVAFVQILN